ncbi:MAG: hypothetical protein JWO81_1727 [Alphaproteobacteria bacterium]|nr:hypothetical protein [Alphaproteobacteria bacterium]
MPALTLYDVLSFAAAQLSSSRRRIARYISGYRPPTYALGHEVPIQTFYDGILFDPLNARAGLEPVAGVPPYGLPVGIEDLAWLPRLQRGLSFAVDPARSFFGDCINVVNAPWEAPLDPMFPPFGWSARSLIGGSAITCSSLHGTIAVTLAKPADGFVEIGLDHGAGLRGEDGRLTAPSGYGIPVRNNHVSDAVPASHGKIELATGRIHDLHYNLVFSNSAIDLLCETNLGLSPPPLLFPGLPHAGHTMAWLALDRAANRLILCIVAQQFLPLGAEVDDVPLRMPASQTAAGQQAPFEAACSGLHPFIFIEAAAQLEETDRNLWAGAQARPPVSFRREAAPPVPAGLESFKRYENRVVSLTCDPGLSDFGDDFSLNNECLGGGAVARSPLFGGLCIQFGSTVANKLPFTIAFESPCEALRSKVARLLTLLPPGTQPGLFGMHGLLAFPNLTYEQHELSLTTDPYKVSVGVIDVETGAFDNVILRKYLFQNVMRRLLLVEPRTPTDSFCYVCDGRFGFEDAHLVMRLYGDFVIPYPEGYGFPLPKRGRTVVGRGSHLQPFVNLYAVEDAAFASCDQSLAFEGRKHLRGRFGAGTTLSAGRDRGRRVVRLAHGSWSVEGRLLAMRAARVGATEIFELEFAMPGPARRDRAEHAYAALLRREDVDELLVVSEQETFDVWLEGALRVDADA